MPLCPQTTQHALNDVSSPPTKNPHPVSYGFIGDRKTTLDITHTTPKHDSDVRKSSRSSTVTKGNCVCPISPGQRVLFPPFSLHPKTFFLLFKRLLYLMKRPLASRNKNTELYRSLPRPPGKNKRFQRHGGDNHTSQAPSQKG